MGTLSLTDPVNGTANDATTIANNNAAIKTVVNGNIDTVNLKDPGTGKVYGSTGAGSAAAVFPPGYEIAYNQITTSFTCTNAYTQAIAGTTVTYDGTPVIVEFFASQITANTNVNVALYDASSEVCVLTAFAITGSGGESGRLRFSPSAGSHTYNAYAKYIGTSGSIVAGSGSGGDNYVPAYLRITKV